ncbi:MAG: glycosyltransferase family 4 protein [Bacteroidales bacterium]|jgi:glycosyltransferase involved in cell wall biosynthesis|nr:glycosyltransferase family 4 protein [Bacteroidales bacterium]
MKLMIILKTNFPYPLLTGGQQGVYHMIDRLRNKIEILILYDKHIVNDKNEIELKRRWSNVKFIPFQKSYITQIHWNFSYLCWLIYKILTKLFINHNLVQKNKVLNGTDEQEYSSDFLDFISSTIETEKVDIIQTEFYNTLNLGYYLPDNIQKVYVQHEIRYVRNYLFIKNQKKINSLDLYKTKKLKHEEIMAMNQYNCIITVTEIDKRKLLNDGVYTKIEASHLCIPSKTVINEYVSTDNKLSFLGGFRHSANVSGLMWFLNEVWHVILKHNSMIELSIIGDWPNKEIVKIQKKYPNINFLGFVDDLYDILHGTIMIVPIIEGSGMRMKILDAVNNGCTFVTTSIGVEGLDFEDGKDCLIADVAEKFAENIITLNTDTKLQKNLFYNSKKTYDSKYSVDIAIEKRLNIYTNLVNNSK